MIPFPDYDMFQGLQTVMKPHKGLDTSQSTASKDNAKTDYTARSLKPVLPVKKSKTSFTLIIAVESCFCCLNGTVTATGATDDLMIIYFYSLI
jgi:hypothetical protein